MIPQKEFRILMLRAGFETQWKLAERAGIAPQTLSAMLKKKRHTISHKKRIAKLLKVPISYLWD